MGTISVQTDGAPAESPLGTLEEVIGAAADNPQGVGSSETAVGEFVPIVLFVAIALTYCVKYYFTHRNRQEVQSTVRTAIERGEALTPELLDRLVEPRSPKRNDLRRGVIGIALGIALCAIGVVIGDEDAMRPLIAVSLVPLLLGGAYLVLWRLSGDQAGN